jgi:hypothetical protein
MPTLPLAAHQTPLCEKVMVIRTSRTCGRDLRELVRRALEDAEGGLWAWGPIEGVPRRQAHALDSSLSGEGAVPVRLRNGFAAAADWSSIIW